VTRSDLPSPSLVDPDRAMADARHSPAESSRRGPEDRGKNVYQDTEGVYAHDSLDPIYVAKAKILNDAFREIGMGRYQVCPLWTSVSVRY